MIDCYRPAYLKPKSPDPLEDEAEVVSGGGEDWVNGITLGVSEVIAVHPVTRLDVTDNQGRKALDTILKNRGAMSDGPNPV